jgi:hypothetical protein
MVATVLCSQVLNGHRKLSFSSGPNLLRLASNDLVRARNETVFIPLSTAAGFPAFATNIAELASAFTAFNG